MTQLTTYSSKGTFLEQSFEIANILLFESYRLYIWLRDIAPVVIKYRLIQLGLNGIDDLPLLSFELKQEVKRWLRNCS